MVTLAPSSQSSRESYLNLKTINLHLSQQPYHQSKAQDGFHLDIDLCFKNDIDSFNKVFLWVQMEVTSIKPKQTQEAIKIETLEDIGTGKFSSLPDFLSELTKAIRNAKEIINAQHNSFQILQNRAGATKKKMEGFENKLKKIEE